MKEPAFLQNARVSLSIECLLADLRGFCPGRLLPMAQPGNRRAVLHRKDLNARLRLQRTDILADAAAIADLLDYIRFLDRSGKAVKPRDPDIA